MGATRACCDDCGIETDEFTVDCDDMYRCHPCDLKARLWRARREYQEHQQRLEPQLEKLTRLKKRLDELEREE